MSSYEVTLIFEDGRVAKFHADEEDTVYFSALKNSVRILTDCLEGACATCKGTCTSGTYTLDEFTDEALTMDEYERREVLTCQMRLKSDCVIEFPYESRIALKSQPQIQKNEVTEITMISSTVSRLVLAPVSDVAGIEFLPGQYVHLSVPGTDHHRSYSFANPPFENEKYTFYVKLLDDGVMSEYLAQRAKVGDEIDLTGPFGRFYLRPVERPIIMVAGGTGLAPMLSMLDTLSAVNNCDYPIRVLYGANNPDEFFAVDQLEGYRTSGLDLTVEYCAVMGNSEWNAPTGHVTSLLRPENLNGGDSEIYLCGPPPMIEAAESWCTTQGVDAALIHAEKFVPS
ncbi:MAG: 2Fe-2S iron-sulfur cluster binding domain-containing protein [Pseudomonadota bacterium]|nr:2Fe-2S iron-sulfur cluster binding domain-containing protein [Pseudomonadota bacterium]